VGILHLLESETVMKQSLVASQRRISRTEVLRALPVVFLVHNLEEAIWMRGFLPLDLARLPALLQAYMPEVTYPQFLLVLLVVTGLPFLILVAANVRRRISAGVYALLAVAAVLLLNVASHVGAALYFGGYTPGLVTALCVNLPVALYTLFRAIQERWMGRWALWSLPLTALVLHGPILVGLLRASSWLLGS
jgi:hypothetical protein